MNRKLFYTLIAFSVLLLFIYTLLKIFILKYTNFPSYPTGKLKDLLGLLILIAESRSAKKTLHKFTITLVLISVIAYLMQIMHWPFANMLFFGSLVINGLLLMFNAIRSNDPWMKLLVLIYPVSRIMLAEPFFNMSSSLWLILEVYIPGIFAGLVLWLRKKI
jgi:hypothetical protein